jgi:hypothetical protein
VERTWKTYGITNEFQGVILDEFSYQGNDIELTPEATTEIGDKLVKLVGNTGSHELHEMLCYRIEIRLDPGEGGPKVRRGLTNHWRRR